MNYLITGSSGFIGHHLCKKILKEGHSVIGVDNQNDYYDVSLKKDRETELKEFLKREGVPHKKYKFIKADLTKKKQIQNIFKKYKFNIVIHLAAQAGVRFSLVKPDEYINSNIIGFYNLLECLKQNKVDHLIFASSSSVYGNSNEEQFSEKQSTDRPISLYAASKKTNEILAHSYSHLYKIKVTGLRFFTVYGPWGRPDMAYFKFFDHISKGKKIEVFNYKKMVRDFTYIDDISDGIYKLSSLNQTNQKKQKKACSLFKIYNMGNNKPEKLENFVKIIEKISKKEAKIKHLGTQPGDVLTTNANISLAKKDFGFNPKTNLKEGLKHFHDWFLSYKNS